MFGRREKCLDEATLERTWMETEYRLDVLRATNGAHVEIF
jgi:hypothetical protein